MEEHWEAFKAWASENGVGLDHEEDYMSWWECFCAGINAAKNQ